MFLRLTDREINTIADLRKKVFSYALIIIIFMALQTTMFDYMKVHDCKPNLLMILVVTAGIIGGYYEGAVVGIVTGMVIDSSSQFPFGLYTLLGLYLGLFAGIPIKSIAKDNYLIAILIVFVSTYLYELMVLLFTLSGPYWTGGVGNVLAALMQMMNPVIWIALYNSVVIVPVHFLLRRVNSRKGKHRRRERIGGSYKWRK